jgi:hypothetical protein
MFKDKTSKKRVYNNNELSTLDAMHNKVINDYSNKIKEDAKIKLEIKKLENEITNINSLIETFKDKEKDNNYNDLWSSNIKIREDIINLKLKLKSINDFSEIDYYENTSYILFNYYDMLEKQSTSTNKSIIKFKNKSIIESFNLITPNTNEIKIDTNKDVIEKSSLVDEYLSVTNNNHIKKIFFDSREICHKCNNNLTCLQHEAIMICNNCGYQEPLLVEQNRPILKQNTKDTSHFSYKRINHFREWCNQVQGKESTDIPNEIFEKILNEIKKEKISDTRNITYNKMREILKRLRINKYYEHINYIINRINGIPTPQFSAELEDKLCNMFRDIQAPFLKHCPKDRKNFLSYSYVLYKFFQILGLNEYLKFFPLLKSREKLYAQDQIWKKICEELNYTIIPSL